MSFSSPILLTSSRRYVMPTTITVEVPSEDGPPRLLQVGVERAAPPKPWLGGYRSKVRPTRCGAAADMPHGHHNPRPLRHAHQESGTEYHHATAQTERPRPSTAEIARAANRAHRAAQTVEQAKSVFRTILATHTVAAVRAFPTCSAGTPSSPLTTTRRACRSSRYVRLPRRWKRPDCTSIRPVMCCERHFRTLTRMRSRRCVSRPRSTCRGTHEDGLRGGCLPSVAPRGSQRRRGGQVGLPHSAFPPLARIAWRERPRRVSDPEPHPGSPPPYRRRRAGPRCRGRGGAGEKGGEAATPAERGGLRRAVFRARGEYLARAQRRPKRCVRVWTNLPIPPLIEGPRRWQSLTRNHFEPLR